jgi:amidase
MNMCTSMFLSVILAFSGVANTIGANTAKPGPHVMKKPSATGFYFEWYFKGDANQNARLILECRKTGDAEWQKQPPPGQKRLNGSAPEGVFSGVLPGLEPLADYECRFVMIDPDGLEGEAVRIVTTRTARLYVSQTDANTRAKDFSIRKPVCRIRDGETVVTKTWQWNPAVGPFHIEGAEPGDTLAIRLEAIEPGNTGYSDVSIRDWVVDPEFKNELPPHGGSDWAIDEKVGVARLSIVRIDKVEEKATLSGLPHPLRPMLGCLGTAVTDPLGQAVTVCTSGPNGGNLDYRGIVEGVTMYFPVFAPGGLCYLSDGHAVQGSGEVLMTGIECGLKKVQFTAWVQKGRKIGWPRGENDDFIFTIEAAEPPLEQSLWHATTEMVCWLQEDYGLDKRSAGILLGMCAESEVGHVVDPAWTMVCRMPKSVLRRLEDERGQTPLHLAVRAGQSAVVQRLLSEGVDVNSKDKFGWTALRVATAEGSEGVAGFLIAGRADVNAQDKIGETPLLLAIDLYRKALAELLLAKGADANLKTRKGQTALDLARQRKHPDVVELLRKHGAKE